MSKNLSASGKRRMQDAGFRIHDSLSSATSAYLILSILSTCCWIFPYTPSHCPGKACCHEPVQALLTIVHPQAWQTSTRTALVSKRLLRYNVPRGTMKWLKDVSVESSTDIWCRSSLYFVSKATSPSAGLVPSSLKARSHASLLRYASLLGPRQYWERRHRRCAERSSLDRRSIWMAIDNLLHHLRCLRVLPSFLENLPSSHSRCSRRILVVSAPPPYPLVFDSSLRVCHGPKKVWFDTDRGVMATLQSTVHNWSGLMALRFFLGAFEAAFA